MTGGAVRYAKSGDIHIAYMVVGEGPLDLVFIPGFVSHVEYLWEDPHAAHFFNRLASFSRLVLFDKRGTGLSDRACEIPTLEQRMDDVRAVMDAVGSSRAAFFGISEGGPMSLLFAATYPQRSRALVVYGSYARAQWAPDHPWGQRPEDVERVLELIDREWGTSSGIDRWAPTLAGNDRYREWWSHYMRLAASPGAARTILRLNSEIDVRHVLSAISVPTLILHRGGETVVDPQQARYLAEQIPGAKHVELSGNDHVPWIGDADSVVDEVEEFLTGSRHGAEPNRVLATVLFTDIVGSTERAAELGDRAWREVLGAYHMRARREVERFRGREIDTAGDGFFAAFDGPARAIRSACRITQAVRPLGIDVRAGLHTGECELIGEKLSGIAVHVGARVAAVAGAGEVLVSTTVKDLVAGSGIRFEHRGVHPLKGIPDTWPLFAVVPESAL